MHKHGSHNTGAIFSVMVIRIHLFKSIQEGTGEHWVIEVDQISPAIKCKKKSEILLEMIHSDYEMKQRGSTNNTSLIIFVSFQRCWRLINLSNDMNNGAKSQEAHLLLTWRYSQHVAVKLAANVKR